jgi:hypothetical protein
VLDDNDLEDFDRIVKKILAAFDAYSDRNSTQRPNAWRPARWFVPVAPRAVE